MLCFGLVAIAAFDVPFQLWQHSRDLKMTREEVKEEYKESEGSPETRGRIREAQRALARGRMMQEVPKADVVITNPTHYAVGPARRENPRNRRRTRRTAGRGAAAGPRTVPQRRARPRSTRSALRDRGAGAHLRLPAQGCHGARGEAAAAAGD